MRRLMKKLHSTGVRVSEKMSELSSANTTVSASNPRYDLTDASELAGRARSGALIVDIENTAGATGLVAIRIAGGGVTVDGTVDLAGGDGQRVLADRAQVQALLGHEVAVTASGTLCPQSGCDGSAFPPFPMVRFETRLELMLELGGEN